MSWGGSSPSESEEGRGMESSWREFLSSLREHVQMAVGLDRRMRKRVDLTRAGTLPDQPLMA
jgi:hypothetical protein